MAEDKFEKLIDLAIRRGFFWSSYEIYGGVAGFYDLGPLGTRLKNNIIELWRKHFIQQHQEFVVEIETPVIAPARVFEASGHLEHFTDPVIECLKCKRKYRADQLVEELAGIKAEGMDLKELLEIIEKKNIKCPNCGGPLGNLRYFNLLFETYIGPYSENKGFLRPETAQGMFVSFKRVFQVMRERLPLGIAQIGKVARNEISPRQSIMRLREFTIMELEFFYDPDKPHCPLLEERYSGEKLRILTADAKSRGEERPEEYEALELINEKIIKAPWLVYWMFVSRDFVHNLGISFTDMFFDEKMPHELAHYSKQTFDQLVKVSRWGWIEVSGHAYRYDYDLARHIEFSGQDLAVFKKFEKPTILKEKKVIIDKAGLAKEFRSEISSLMRILESMSNEKLLKVVESSTDVVVIDKFRIPKRYFKVIEVEKKIYGKKYVPHVVEPSFGAERLLYVTLDHAFHESEERVVLKLPPYLAPIQVAVFPLLSRKEFILKAREIHMKLIREGFYVIYDDSGSIGRRYARADEIGVPFAITIDYQTLKDNTVTIRDRDSRKQIRVRIEDLSKILYKGLKGENIFEFV
ncbi:MAG: glycine--tRNA ligase [Thermoprotei archaeon]|nr:MAG: glycine--tRNA ligase [Thermoprotei archaeon]